MFLSLKSGGPLMSTHFRLKLDKESNGIQSNILEEENKITKNKKMFDNQRPHSSPPPPSISP